MQLPHASLKREVPPLRRLHEKQHFLRPLHFPSPHVARPHSRQHIHARGEVFLHHHLSDPLSLFPALTRDKHDEFSRHIPYDP